MFVFSPSFVCYRKRWLWEHWWWRLFAYPRATSCRTFSTTALREVPSLWNIRTFSHWLPWNHHVTLTQDNLRFYSWKSTQPMKEHFLSERWHISDIWTALHPWIHQWETNREVDWQLKWTGLLKCTRLIIRVTVEINITTAHFWLA